MTSAATYRPRMARARAALATIARTGPNAGPQHVTVTLLGEVGVGKSASLAGVKAQLAKAPNASRMRIIINSPGGNVREALKIYSALREHPATAKSARVVGQCASAAVLPFLAADHRETAAGAEITVHNAAIENRVVSAKRQTAERLRMCAEVIAQADDRMLALLTERTGTARSVFVRAMRTDKPMRAADALQSGLVHEIEGCAISRPCDPQWPTAGRALALAGAMIGLPRHLFTANYSAACRAAPRGTGRVNTYSKGERQPRGAITSTTAAPVKKLDLIEMTRAAKKPKAPAHLSEASRAWWREVVVGWALESHHVRLLTAACEAWDRACEAQTMLARDGLCIPGREGGLRPHPAVAIRRDAETSFARLLRELDLDVEAPGSVRSGPPALRSNRGGY